MANYIDPDPREVRVGTCLGCGACLRPVGGSGAYIITRVVFCPACARRALAVLTLWDEIHNSPLREAA